MRRCAKTSSTLFLTFEIGFRGFGTTKTRNNLLPNMAALTKNSQMGGAHSRGAIAQIWTRFHKWHPAAYQGKSQNALPTILFCLQRKRAVMIEFFTENYNKGSKCVKSSDSSMPHKRQHLSNHKRLATSAQVFAHNAKSSASKP